VTTKKKYDDLISKQFNELTRREQYPDLQIKRNSEDGWIVYGTLYYRAINEGHLIKDKFEIRIEIPPDYPKSTPVVYDEDGRTKGYPHTQNDGKLCLAEPVKEWMIFTENPTLLYYVQKLVIPYLYRFRFIEAHNGEKPWGERSHGGVGIIEHYEEYFNVTGKEKVLGLLEHLSIHKEIKGHPKCPCGSGELIRNCHVDELRRLKEVPKKIVKYVIDQIKSSK